MIHSTAVVETDSIGEGTKIWHFVHVREGVRIGKNCTIGKGVYIDKDVTIGNNVKIQNFVSVYKGVTIDDEVFIGPSVTFTNDRYPRSFRWDESEITPTHVKKGASIGANATIICGVTLGKYAMIGAGSVVTMNIPDHGLVYGNPAVLKGIVCICGRKTQVKKEKKDSVVYYCTHCKKKIEIPMSAHETVIEE